MGVGMAEQRRKLVRLAVLEELRASYGIKVKSGSCLGTAKQLAAAAAEVSEALTVCSGRVPLHLRGGAAECGGSNFSRGWELPFGLGSSEAGSGLGDLSAVLLLLPAADRA